MKKTKDELKQIFNDTKRTAWIKNQKSPTKKLKEQEVEIPESIIVKITDTVSAATEYANRGRTCVLNMASAKTAGGGVADGEMAQEECLFRCSNLAETITQDLYPLGEDEALYTKNALFFKDKYYEHMEPIKVDVVTIAAVNLNPNAKYDEKKEVWVNGFIPKPKNYDELTLVKIRTMLSLAAKNKSKYIILGAWGCGVFNNDPYDIAELFCEVLVNEGYQRLFTQVVFAIINDSNSVGNNVDVFQEVFGVAN